MPNRWIDSRGVNAVAVALAGQPGEPAWRERVWTAIYEEGRDPGDQAELLRLTRDLDLDAGPLSGRRALEALEVRTLLAKESGVTGVPTFMLGEWPVGGIHGDATMRSLLGRYVRRAREAAL